MSMTIFRREAIRRLIEANGAVCHYCSNAVRLRVSAKDHHADDATIDHKIPKSKGGTNADDNLLLACRRCNEAKEDRTYADFLERPYSLRAVKVRPKKRPRYMPKPEVIEATKKADKILRWSMAAAIQRGELAENGQYRKAPVDTKPEPRKPAAPKMTALEAAVWLRQMHEKRGKPWPLA